MGIIYAKTIKLIMRYINQKFTTLILTLSLVLWTIQDVMAAPFEDFFRSTGKIYVVVAIIAITFLVIVFYLIRLERKINKLEKLQQHESQTS